MSDINAPVPADDRAPAVRHWAEKAAQELQQVLKTFQQPSSDRQKSVLSVASDLLDRAHGLGLIHGEPRADDPIRRANNAQVSRSRVELRCACCGKLFLRSRGSYNEEYRRRAKAKRDTATWYCSSKCVGAARKQSRMSAATDLNHSATSTPEKP